jgi:hypothetical protein
MRSRNSNSLQLNIIYKQNLKNQVFRSSLKIRELQFDFFSKKIQGGQKMQLGKLCLSGFSIYHYSIFSIFKSKKQKINEY